MPDAAAAPFQISLLFLFREQKESGAPARGLSVSEHSFIAGRKYSKLECNRWRKVSTDSIAYATE